MEKEIAEGNLGQIGKYDIEFKGGKLVLKLDAEVKPAVASLFVSVDAAEVIDALAKAIPGAIDDFAFGLIKAALLK